MGILTNFTKEIKTNFSNFDICVSSGYEDCRLRGYDPVWPGINLLTCRRKALSPYYTPKTPVNFYDIARRHVTADFNFNNLSIVFIWFFGEFIVAVNYTNTVHGKVSPSCRFATLVSGTGSRVRWTLEIFPRIKAMFHRQFSANCVYFPQLSWWLDRNHIFMLR
jgi:hypothetical protein